MVMIDVKFRCLTEDDRSFAWTIATHFGVRSIIDEDYLRVSCVHPGYLMSMK